MIEAKNVVKVFGLRPVLRGVSLSVAPGEFLSLFGPNGAGKTTLLRILATLSRPTGGSVTIGGYAVPNQAQQARGLIGLVSHQPLLYGDLTARENLEFYSRMYGLDKASRGARIDEVLKAVNLIKRAGDLVRTFSRGMQQRLAIARAVLHDPPVLLLDEPYTGLDQDAALSLDKVLREVALRGRTILMTTHDIQHGLSLCDHAAILAKGVIAYRATKAQLNKVDFTATYSDVTGMASVR
jgi:heme exporter protein A